MSAKLLGANLPAPLYDTYRQRFGLSTTVLMLVFTTYAIVLIPSLIIFGQLSDVVGCTKVIVGALAVSAIGLGLFAGAQNAAWLFAARDAQGLAVGSASATATASPLALIAIGLAALVVAWPLHSLPILLVAAVCAGAGLGLSFGGSQTTVNQLAPRQRRGEVTAAYITVVYIAITVASLTVG